MVTVVGHWEWRDMVPMTEAPLWNLPLRDFGIEDWRMVPVSGIKNSQRKVELSEYPDYASALEDGTDRPRVFIEPRTVHQNPITTWLPNFRHPKDCIYIFGSAHYNPTMFHRRPDDPVVTIPTVQNRGVLWPHQAALIVLYDRTQRGHC